LYYTIGIGCDVWLLETVECMYKILVEE